MKRFQFIKACSHGNERKLKTAQSPERLLILPTKHQVRISGRVEVVSNREADDYFSSRPRGAQIGAWASAQSRIIPSKRQLEKNLAQYTAKFGVKKVPRPPFWSGYRIVPNEYEFWQERPNRLHTRERYNFQDEVWTVSYLYP